MAVVTRYNFAVPAQDSDFWTGTAQLDHYFEKGGDCDYLVKQQYKLPWPVNLRPPENSQITGLAHAFLAGTQHQVHMYVCMHISCLECDFSPTRACMALLYVAVKVFHLSLLSLMEEIHYYNLNIKRST